jgi:hypothetical protein
VINGEDQLWLMQNGTWISAESIHMMKLKTALGTDLIFASTQRAPSIKQLSSNESVEDWQHRHAVLLYELELANVHTYYVTNAAAVVHNVEGNEDTELFH